MRTVAQAPDQQASGPPGRAAPARERGPEACRGTVPGPGWKTSRQSWRLGGGAVTRRFVIKARSAPTEAAAFRAAVGQGPRVEFLVRILVDALFVAQGHRSDTVVHLVLERSQDFSRVVTFDGGVIGTLPGLTEAALVEAVAGPLDAARALPKDGSLRTDAGVEVRATSFEHFVKELAGAGPLYLLDRRGDDIEGLTDVPDPTFVLTDHTPLPRNTARWLRRLGAQPLALGPTTLFASQCVTLLHSRLDRAAGF